MFCNPGSQISLPMPRFVSMGDDSIPPPLEKRSTINILFLLTEDPEEIHRGGSACRELILPGFLEVEAPESIVCKAYFERLFLASISPCLMRGLSAPQHSLGLISYSRCHFDLRLRMQWKHPNFNLLARCWRDLDAITASGYDMITVLCCNNYHYYPREFQQLVEGVLPAAQKRSPGIRILNDPSILSWNWDKYYLNDLAHQGFQILRTEFVDLDKHTKSSFMKAFVHHARSRPVVLKPAISGSARLTYLVKDAGALRGEYQQYLDSLLNEGTSGDLMIHEYAAESEQGKYSLIVIDGRHSHRVLKKPKAHDWFRANMVA